jgi:translation initiation factor 2B subunit (eIF-2B alpha/beta/delta family)
MVERRSDLFVGALEAQQRADMVEVLVLGDLVALEPGEELVTADRLDVITRTEVAGREPVESVDLRSGEVTQVRISPDATPAANPAFDVTPARLVTGLITERGIAEASAEGLLKLFPERAKAAA